MKLENLNAAIDRYRTRWKAFVELRTHQKFFSALEPIAVAWKVADRGDALEIVDWLRGRADQVHLIWLDGRWLGTVHLADSLQWGLTVVKIMERRPGSQDQEGLDHVDFLIPESRRSTGGRSAIRTLTDEPGLEWKEERGSYAWWYSMNVCGKEAKLRYAAETTPMACARELERLNQTIVL